MMGHENTRLFSIWRRSGQCLGLFAALLLTGCATVRDYATCDNARAAVVLAERAVERVCPINP